MAADVTLEKDYTVKNRNIFLAVTIGEGQFGTSDVFLDADQLLRASGPIKLLIGKGSEIADKTLLIRSVVNDVNAATNRMSVKYRLTGGAAAGEFVAKGKVTDAGELLVFEATFSLVPA